MVTKKTTISIGDVSITIPYNGEDISDVMTAMELALELYGWHRNTIEDYIIERAFELENDRK